MDSLAKVTAVWGGPSTGKTVLSAKLAKYLSSKKYNVILLLCDTDAPPLPLLLPPSELDAQKSLGSILAAAKINETLILQNCITIKKNSYLSILGLLKNENCFCYPKYTKNQAAELIGSLRKLADYVIIDCGSHISDDILSTVALIDSDIVLRLINCDLKSISYLSSQLPLLADKQFRLDKQVKIANNVKSIHDNENIEQILGNVQYTIPFCAHIETQYLSGELLKSLNNTKDAKTVKQLIEKICKEVLKLQ